MEYKELAQLYYMNASNSRDVDIRKELDARINSESAFRLGIDTPHGELFFTIPRELLLLSNHVLQTEHKIFHLLNALPEIAKGAVLRSMVLDEVVCTNEIEAIQSTRRQIKEVFAVKKRTTSQTERFRELAMLYLSLIDGPNETLIEAADVRKIYDKVMAGEDLSQNAPDGRIFRKGSVDVVAANMRKIHHGVEPEAKIIEIIDNMLLLVKDESIPPLYSALASHYIFEYAHPFYDGNGRTGRYILSFLLSNILSVPTALSLSRTIVERKEAYYRAFRTAEDPMNHAELTFFIYTMLDFAYSSQLGVVRRLEESCKVAESVHGAMEQLKKRFELKAKEGEIVSILLQYEKFGLFGDASVQDVADLLKTGTQQARRYLSSLEEKGVCRKLDVYNPIMFKLTDDVLNIASVFLGD